MQTAHVKAYGQRAGGLGGARQILSSSVALAEAAVGYRDPEFSQHCTVDPSRILIVDADFSRGAATAALVHSIGWFEIRRTCSARAALSVAGDFLPGIVLLSTDLPDLASYSLASALHRHTALSSARLIAVTADISGADRGYALSSGFERYLMFPLQQLALRGILLPGRREARRGRGSPQRRH